MSRKEKNVHPRSELVEIIHFIPPLHEVPQNFQELYVRRNNTRNILQCSSGTEDRSTGHINFKFQISTLKWNSLEHLFFTVIAYGTSTSLKSSYITRNHRDRHHRNHRDLTRPFNEITQPCVQL